MHVKLTNEKVQPLPVCEKVRNVRKIGQALVDALRQVDFLFNAGKTKVLTTQWKFGHGAVHTNG